MPNLDTMVADVERLYPGVMYRDGAKSQAKAAAEIVRRQGCQPCNPADLGGLWRVDDCTCGIHSGGCTCLDERAPRDNKGGKLCKHRIAAIMAYKMRNEHGIAKILSMTSADVVTLIVDVFYADGGRQYTLSGWRERGARDAYTLEYDQRIRFTAAEFDQAVAAAGFGLVDRPIRMIGFAYHYRLTRGAASVYTADALTGEDVDRKAQRERLAEIAALDNGEADSEVMQHLPAAMQQAILSKAGLAR